MIFERKEVFVANEHQIGHSFPMKKSGTIKENVSFQTGLKNGLTARAWRSRGVMEP
ncbi:hypothetical protein ACYE2N_12060 [Flavobacterium sp. MAHUQ-51]|uniref:hypothetical protein n=1 Tax=Flavobacterium sp. GCM10022190 TaxID=3252639 RepID=UPI003613E9EC